MDVQPITMEKGEARKAFLEYRTAVRERHSDEDEALMRGYKALANGMQLLDLHDAFRRAGVDDQGRPNLAIARCDSGNMCFYQWSEVRPCFTTRVDRWGRPNFNTAARRLETRLASEIIPKPAARPWQNWKAIVPPVPAGLRPKGKLDRFHILWEAVWAPAPPSDPYLLRHLHGPLYAVLAQWDLTPLEQSVMMGRLQ